MANIIFNLSTKHLILMLACCFVLSSCVQQWQFNIPKFANKSDDSIPKATIKTVNRSFYGHFMVGDWQFKGAKANQGEIKAYIQIPQPLQMSTDLQRQYIQKLICPKQDKIELWNKLKSTKLSVHIYTSSQNKSVGAHCHNPWISDSTKQA